MTILKKKNYELLDFKLMGDERGLLIPFEENNNVPFDIKRVFYIFDTKGSIVRGNHANKNSKFLLIAINGSCTVKIDDGKEQVDFLLNRPDKGLFINNMVWKEMSEFSYNTTLIVFSNEYYNENEYIRNYDEFLKIVSNK